MKLFLFIISGLIFGCNSDLKKSRTEKRRLSPVTQWLVDNEDSLFRSFSEWVKIDTLKNKANGEIVTREYLINEGIFAGLNEQIHKVGDCINVIYLLQTKAAPYFDIFLTANFDTACVGPIDMVFSDLDSLRRFRITKYRPHIGRFSKYIIDADTLEMSEIAVKLTEHSNKYDVTLYLKRPTLPETKEQLKNELLGEEFLLKQAGTISFGQLTDTVQGALTVDQLWRFIDKRL